MSATYKHIGRVIHPVDAMPKPEIIAMKMLTAFLQDETGATAIEYGLIAAIMGIGVAGGVSSYGQNVTKLYNDIYQAFLDTY